MVSLTFQWVLNNINFNNKANLLTATNLTLFDDSESEIQTVDFRPTFDCIYSIVDQVPLLKWFQWNHFLLLSRESAPSALWSFIVQTSLHIQIPVACFWWNCFLSFHVPFRSCLSPKRKWFRSCDEKCLRYNWKTEWLETLFTVESLCWHLNNIRRVELLIKFVDLSWLLLSFRLMPRRIENLINELTRWASISPQISQCCIGEWHFSRLPISVYTLNSCTESVQCCLRGKNLPSPWKKNLIRSTWISGHCSKRFVRNQLI